MCIRHQEKATKKLQQQQDPAASLDEMVQTATNIFYNRTEKGGQGLGKEKRRETRRAQILATLQGSPMANPESLKDKARGKCLIYRQVGHWAKLCPNYRKSPKMVCYKHHQLEH